MKVLVTIPTFPPAADYGGPALAAYAVARELMGLGHQVLTLALDLGGGGPRGVDTTYRGVPVRYCRGSAGPPFFSLEMARELGRRLPFHDLCLSRGNWSFVNYLTRRACRRARVAYVLYPEGSFDPWAIQHKALRKRLWWRLVEEANYQQAAAVIALTAAEADQVRQMGIRSRIEVIPNGVDPEDFAGALSREELEAQFPGLGPEPYLLFLGRVHEKKGLPLALAALAQLPAKLAGTRLVVAGPGEERYLQHLQKIAADLGLGGRVRFLGPVNGAAKAGLLQEADLFILTSRSEGLPIAVLEAMACGTPVLISPFCHLPEVAAAGAGMEAGLEPEEIARALAEILADSAARRQMGEAGRRLVAEKFTWPRVGQLTAALCADLAGD